MMRVQAPLNTKHDDAHERVLISAIAEGDHDALGELYRLYANELEGYFASRIGNNDAKDLLHDVFEAIPKSAKRFQGKSSVRTWLYGICRRKLRRHINDEKKRERQAVLEREMALRQRIISPEDEALRELWHEKVWDALKVLHRSSPQMFEVVRLFYAEGLTLSEIAQRLMLPIGTVKSRLHRARRSLRKHLLEKWQGWNL